MYESRKQPLLPPSDFLRRLLAHLAAACVLLLASIVLGMAGYMHYEHLAPLDAFLDTAMLLGGMGPVHIPVSDAGKLFAGCFALYAGIVFIATAALLLGPVAHRVLHRFHLDKD
ncbi:MAG TPA: hypothetical protein VIG03_02145 [Steroidobacteraceae bacterium]|jgi:hypothetical protein